MGDAREVHNQTVKRIIREIVLAADGRRIELAIIAESLLLGVGMFSYPSDARRQALFIQEIADGAADRAKVVRRP